MNCNEEESNISNRAMVILGILHNDTVSRDEAEVLAGRFKSISARYDVLYDPEKLTYKYITAWMNFGIRLSHIGCGYLDQFDHKSIIRTEKLSLVEI
jgi:hypothetical protein